jgi:hypothetical protein
MKLRKFIATSLAVFAALCVAGHLVGCSEPLTTQQKEIAAGHSYGGDLLACVDDAGTRGDSQACREKVRQKWHVVDGGVR